MSGISIRGIGAVSPAGWGVAALRDALEKDVPIESQPLKRPGWEEPLFIRAVPPCAPRPDFLAHPRLRRSGPLTQHTVAAALEAIGNDAVAIRGGQLRLGIVVCLMAGNVAYSRRFYEEAWRDPSSASPLIFPETVFNAPASHLATCLNSTNVTHTLVGDEGTFLQGLALAANWLVDGAIQAAVVIGAEEIDWLVADALKLFHAQSVHGAGAAALYLRPTTAGPALPELAGVTDSFPFAANLTRADAAQKMRAQLPAGSARDLLCHSFQGIGKLDAAEKNAWANWGGARRATKTILGQAFTASAAWQCVAACDAINLNGFASATVSVVGANQQAIGAQFTKALSGNAP